MYNFDLLILSSLSSSLYLIFDIEFYSIETQWPNIFPQAKKIIELAHLKDIHLVLYSFFFGLAVNKVINDKAHSIFFFKR